MINPLGGDLPRLRSGIVSRLADARTLFFSRVNITACRLRIVWYKSLTTKTNRPCHRRMAVLRDYFTNSSGGVCNEGPGTILRAAIYLESGFGPDV